MRVLGYVRVSTEEQSNSGAGLEAQRRAILAECERRGWHLVAVIEDAGFSAKDMKRPGVQEALPVKRAGGVRLGRPPSLPMSVVRRIQRQRARGDSLRKIADDLNAVGTPTAHGGVRWYAGTVAYTLKRSQPRVTRGAQAERL